MDLIEILGLFAAAAAGGCINAVAGGGTLITFPTLLFFGMPPVQANATSTLALVIGTSGSIVGYRRHLPRIRPWLAWFVPVSLAGGLIGSLLLTGTPNEVFGRLVPFLILFATLLFTGQNLFRRFIRLESGGPSGLRIPWGAICFQFLVAVYGGYFGAGIGILMLASLAVVGLHDIHEMNTLKTVLGSLINLVAAVWFVISGLIQWPEAGVMTTGAVSGYFLGAHFAQRIPAVRVRQIITAIGFMLAAITFYREFIR